MARKVKTNPNKVNQYTDPDPRQIEEVKKILSDFMEKVKEESKTARWNYIYIIQCNEFFKIGRTYNVEKRLESLQCANPYRLAIIYKEKNPKTIELEEIIHEKFKDKRERNEWFKLTWEDINEVRILVETYGKEEI